MFVHSLYGVIARGKTALLACRTSAVTTAATAAGLSVAAPVCGQYASSDVSRGMCEDLAAARGGEQQQRLEAVLSLAAAVVTGQTHSGSSWLVTWHRLARPTRLSCYCPWHCCCRRQLQLTCTNWAPGTSQPNLPTSIASQASGQHACLQ